MPNSNTSKQKGGSEICKLIFSCLTSDLEANFEVSHIRCFFKNKYLKNKMYFVFQRVLTCLKEHI